MLSLNAVGENIFIETVQEVLTESSYRTNMQKLSSLHRDTVDSALFWTEFVMRHDGVLEYK